MTSPRSGPQLVNPTAGAPDLVWRKFKLGEALSAGGTAKVSQWWWWNPMADGGDGDWQEGTSLDPNLKVRDTVGWWTGASGKLGLAIGRPSVNGTVWDVVDLEC